MLLSDKTIHPSVTEVAIPSVMNIARGFCTGVTFSLNGQGLYEVHSLLSSLHACFCHLFRNCCCFKNNLFDITPNDIGEGRVTSLFQLVSVFAFGTRKVQRFVDFFPCLS